MLLASSAYKSMVQVVQGQIGTQPAINGVCKQSHDVTGFRSHVGVTCQGYVSKGAVTK